MCRRHHARLRLTDTIEPMLEAGTRRRDGRVWDRCVAMRERRTENEARRYETGNCGTKEEMVWRKREPCRHAQKTEPLRPCGLAGEKAADRSSARAQSARRAKPDPPGWRWLRALGPGARGVCLRVCVSMGLRPLALPRCGCCAVCGSGGAAQGSARQREPLMLVRG